MEEPVPVTEVGDEGGQRLQPGDLSAEEAVPDLLQALERTRSTGSWQQERPTTSTRQMKGHHDCHSHNPR